MPKTALFDMDGTLFDHDGQVRKDMIPLASPDENIEELLDSASTHELIKTHPHLAARFDLIRRQPGWWENLPVLPLGWHIFHVSTEIGFCNHILTKGPISKPLAWSEKVKCIHKHFGEDQPIDIVGKDKSSTYGRVLVDDYPDYVLGWLQHRPRGLAILPTGAVNHGFKHANAIIYNGGNLGEVWEHLRAAFDRNRGQHWRELLR